MEFFKDEIAFSFEYSALATARTQLRSNMVNKTSSSSARKQDLSSSKTLDNLSPLEPLHKSLGLSSVAPEAWAGLVARLDKGEQEWENFYR